MQHKLDWENAGLRIKIYYVFRLLLRATEKVMRFKMPRFTRLIFNRLLQKQGLALTNSWLFPALEFQGLEENPKHVGKNLLDP